MKDSLTHDELMKVVEHFFAICKHELEIRKHEQEIYWLLDLPMPQEKPKEKEFPSMSKAELAKAAGVTSRAFRRSLRKHQAELEKMGIRKSAKILPPQAVKYLYDKGEIDIPDLQKNN